MTAAPALAQERADIQRLVATGYSLHESRHFILRVDDATKARAFLRELADRGLYTDAAVRSADITAMLDQHCPLNIGFTFRGLQALEVPQRYLRVFQEKARAFAEGAFARAAARLADTGPSAAERWDEPFAPERAHVVLSLHADERGQLDRFMQSMRGGRSDDDTGLHGWHQPLEAAHLSRERQQRQVHFGFLDGVTKIGIEGLHEGSQARQMHAPGEFLLGYRNTGGFNPWLLVEPGGRRNPWLRPTANIAPEFFRNGSFGVLRRIEQHVAEFEAFVNRSAARHNVSPEYIKAKLLGRWSDGRVVQPNADDDFRAPSASTSDHRDDFGFSDDPDGLGCPFGSHIRRMKGRDTRLAQPRVRALIRRGMPYGPPYDAANQKDGIERGLLGIFFCASLEDQFEHLLSQWADANPLGPRNRSTAKDPLIGNHESPTAFYEIPLKGEKFYRLDGFRPFTRTRGTLYAFFPGKTALKCIASHAW